MKEHGLSSKHSSLHVALWLGTAFITIPPTVWLSMDHMTSKTHGGFHKRACCVLDSPGSLRGRGKTRAKNERTTFSSRPPNIMLPSSQT